VCVTLLLLLGGGPAQADRNGNDQRLRHPERGEATRETPRLTPGGLRHRDYDRPIANPPRNRGGPRQPDDDYRREAVPAPGRPVNDVIKQVERRYGGRVVGVQQEGAYYRVRVLQRDGRVKTVTMPAN
jgi:hypothetical protein